MSNVKKQLKKNCICAVVFLLAFLTGFAGEGGLLCRAETRANKELQVNMSESVKAPQEELWIDYEGGSLWLKLYYGQDGMIRAGRNAWVMAELSAYGTAFSGELELLMLNEQENHISYSVELSAGKDGEGEVALVLPMNLLTGAFYIKLLDSDKTVLAERMSYPEIVNFGTCLNVGVMLPEHSADYLTSFGAHVEYIGRASLKENYLMLDAYDVLLIEEAELAELDVAVSSALEQWVRQGRVLLVTTAENETTAADTPLNLGMQEKEIIQPLVERISLYEGEHNAVLLQNEERTEKYGSFAKQTYTGESMIGSMLVNTLSDEVVRKAVTVPAWKATGWWDTPKTGQRVLWQEQGMPVIQQFDCGEGVVRYLSFAARTEQRNIYPLFYYRLAELLYGELPEALRNQLEYEQYGMEREVSAYLLEYFEKKGERISVLPYVIILVVYLCICLPVLYWWMKRKGVSKYLWGGFPLAALLFLLLIYGVGRNNRISQPFCTWLNVADYTNGQGQGKIYFDVSLPTHRETELSLDVSATVAFAETMFQSYQAEWNQEPVLPEHILQERNARLRVGVKETGTELVLQNVAAFSRTAIQALYVPDAAPELVAHVQKDEDGLSGTVVNRSEEAFEEAMLYTDGVLVRLGELLPGEEKQLEELPQYRLEEESIYSEELLNWLLLPYGEEQGARLGCGYFVMDELWERGEENGWLIAFTAKPEATPLQELASAEHSAGMTAVILPVD